MTSAASASLVGNIYLGIVQNVLPSMEAAFVDIGRAATACSTPVKSTGRLPDSAGRNARSSRRSSPAITSSSRSARTRSGTRAPGSPSDLAGRALPGLRCPARRRPDQPQAAGHRASAAQGDPARGRARRRRGHHPHRVRRREEDDIRADVTRLQERWNTIAAEADRVKASKAGAAVALYEEPDVLVKVIRDLFNEDFSGLIVSGDRAWETITGYVTSVAPELLPKLTKYEPAGG